MTLFPRGAIRLQLNAKSKHCFFYYITNRWPGTKFIFEGPSSAHAPITYPKTPFSPRGES